VGWAMDSPGDDAVVSGIGDQDREALAEAYRRHGGAVWAVVRRVCGSTPLAEQVCEGVFAELWSQPRRFAPERGSLRSRLVAEAHARAVQAARSSDGSPTGSPPPSAEVEVAEHAATLSAAPRKAVDQLASPERAAILLSYQAGHSCRETARRLGTSEDAVKRHIRQGLARLRQALDGQEVAR
jgi:RNA polymerase sigma-70 factor (ECF subfamily)